MLYYHVLHLGFSCCVLDRTWSSVGGISLSDYLLIHSSVGSEVSVFVLISDAGVDIDACCIADWVVVRIQRFSQAGCRSRL